MVYFISGHRDLTKKEFEAYYISRIDSIINKDENALFVLGNSPGTDTYAIEYLDSRGKFFKVYQYEDYLPPIKRGIVVRKFDDANERDAYLTRISDIDIAFVKKGKEDSCTAKNILRRHLI